MTVLDVYSALAAPGIVLLVYVAQRAEHDETCLKDPPALRWARRSMFWAAALALGNSVYDAMSQTSMLLLVASAYGILGVNALVLRLRRPPRDRGVEHVYHAPIRARRPF